MPALNYCAFSLQRLAIIIMVHLFTLWQKTNFQRQIKVFSRFPIDFQTSRRQNERLTERDFGENSSKENHLTIDMVSGGLPLSLFIFPCFIFCCYSLVTGW